MHVPPADDLALPAQPPAGLDRPSSDVPYGAAREGVTAVIGRSRLDHHGSRSARSDAVLG
eukprot:10130033-Alexandrium_andersonii.AAC.1